MSQAVVNEHLTAIMARSGCNITYYTVKCPVCGKDTDLMLSQGQDLSDRLAIHLAELREYHEPAQWPEDKEADGADDILP